jgi:hypothetical protein
MCSLKTLAEEDILNGKIVRKGWYVDPKTGQRIETDY